MPQSLAKILVHLVFSTKGRAPTIPAARRQELHQYMGAVLRNLECPPMQVGGTEDHVHLLFRLSRTVTVAQVAEKVKTSSSKWMGLEFAWQSGYGAFSISTGDSGSVVAYIQSQEEHHLRVTFEDELRAMLAEAGIRFRRAVRVGLIADLRPAGCGCAAHPGLRPGLPDGRPVGPAGKSSIL